MRRAFSDILSDILVIYEGQKCPKHKRRKVVVKRVVFDPDESCNGRLYGEEEEASSEEGHDGSSVVAAAEYEKERPKHIELALDCEGPHRSHASVVQMVSGILEELLGILEDSADKLGDGSGPGYDPFAVGFAEEEKNAGHKDAQKHHGEYSEETPLIEGAYERFSRFNPLQEAASGQLINFFAKRERNDESGNSEEKIYTAFAR